MAIDYYKGHDTYVIYGEETSYGAGATVSGSNDFGKVTSFSPTVTNNLTSYYGIGRGRNAQDIQPLGLEVSGTMDMNLSNLEALQYVIGQLQGLGSVGTPYELEELDNIGYGANLIPSLTLEAVGFGATADHVERITGVVFTDLTITATQGEVMTASMSWLGKTIEDDTTASASYTPSSGKPFVFQEGSLQIDSETVFAVTSFQLQQLTNIQSHYFLGNRATNQPSTGKREYTVQMNLRLSSNDAVSTLSPVELRGLLYGAKGNTTPDLTAGSFTGYPLQLVINEGASSGDRVLTIQLVDFYVDSVQETVNNDDAVTEMVVSGRAISGGSGTSSTNPVPITWYTI